MFQKACAIAEHACLWWCLPDLRSNLRRSELEEGRIAGAAEDRIKAFLQLENEVRTTGQAHGIPKVDSATSEGSLTSLPLSHQEFLRGFSSVLHNLAFAAMKTNRPLSMAASRESQAICATLSDNYRWAQAVTHQALLLEGSDPREARALFEQVEQSKWFRGRRIARQRLAKLRGTTPIDNKEADVLGASEAFVTLFEEIAQEQMARGGDVGFDLDFHFYTVNAFEKLIKSDLAKERLSDARLQALRERLEEEREKLIHSQRRVVVIGKYKNSFANFIRPIYLDWIAARLAGENPAAPGVPDQRQAVQPSMDKQAD
jgi:hypothetical protein